MTNTLKRKVLQLRHKFLRERGTEGGTKQEFSEWLLKHLPDLLSSITANQAVIALSSSFWRARLRPENQQQIEIQFDGDALPYIIRFHAEERAGSNDRDVSVLSEYATVWQLGGFVDIKAENKERCDRAYERTKKQYELALARSGGDGFASLCWIQDGFEDAM